MIEQNLQQIFNSQREYFYTNSTRDISFRILMLKKLRNQIIETQKEIEEALYIDLHKSPTESYITEIGFVLSEINRCIKSLKLWSKPKRVASSIACFPSSARIISEPYGVCLIISPWNYPFQLLISPLIGAISAGNCAILKPSEHSPHTSKIIEKIISNVFPNNYVFTALGEKEVSQELLEKDFDYIFFTGSSNLGKHVMEKASQHLTPITLELGGKSPCIIDKDANIEISAKRVCFGKFLNAGQTCIAPDYLFVHKDIKEKFVEKLIESIHQFFSQDIINSKDYGRIINQVHFQRLKRMLEDGKILFGGDNNEELKYISPTLIEDISPNSDLLSQEIFGPILPIISFENIDKLVQELRRKPKPLALYVFSQSRKTQQKVISNISSGGVCINDTIMHIVPHGLPFGGVGNSGIGSYHSKKSFDTFSHQKSVLDRKTWLDVPLRYPPFTETTKKIVKKIM
ncbi:MAG: aldehyde dehydrogenase [Bacteroidales bacterium]|nr:aldehyde dehydrogenase [Bacteroidales bacterium]